MENIAYTIHKDELGGPHYGTHKLFLNEQRNLKKVLSHINIHWCRLPNSYTYFKPKSSEQPKYNFIPITNNSSNAIKVV